MTAACGGYGLFGGEFFVKGDEVYFSEGSPRPHDTGMVTMVSQDLSEFALHVRAILGLPIPEIAARGPAASVAVLGEGNGRNIRFEGLAEALALPGTEVRLFGKPEVRGERRLAVALAAGTSVDSARAKARRAAQALKITID